MGSKKNIYVYFMEKITVYIIIIYYTSTFRYFSPHAALHTHSWYKQKDLLQPGLGYQELITDAKERQRCFQCTDREMNTYTFSYNIFLYRFIDCIFLMSLREDILFIETVTVVDERLQYVGLCSEANFIVPYLLWHGTSFLCGAIRRTNKF